MVLIPPANGVDVCMSLKRELLHRTEKSGGWDNTNKLQSGGVRAIDMRRREQRAVPCPRVLKSRIGSVH